MLDRSRGARVRPHSCVALVVGALIMLAAPVTAEGAVVVPAVPTPIVAVTMDCPEGGIDINSAGSDRLEGLPGVSAPIAARIIAARPFLRPDPDLLLVAGIGPAKLAAIMASGRVCAEPPTLPPPYFDVCQAGDGRIDLNRPESEPALAGLLGRPTAARVIDGIPYWSVKHVRAEGEPGAGGGKIAKLRGKLCVTPPTIVHDGTRYGWMDPDRGGLVDFPVAGGPSYRLTVPGGVVTARPGAWGSVTAPVNLDNELAPGVPGGDFHIHGAWSGRVYVGLPPDTVPGEQPGEWVDTFWHKAPGGWELTWGEANVERIDGRVTAGLTSLSWNGVVRMVRSVVSTVVDGFISLVAWTEQTIRRLLDIGANPPSCSPNAPEGTQRDGAVLSTTGAMLEPLPFTSPLLRCIERAPRQDPATWRFAFNRGGALSVRDQGSNGADFVTREGISGVLLSDIFLSLFNASPLPGLLGYHLVDQQSFRVNLRSANSPGVLRVRPAPVTSLILFGLGMVSEIPQVKLIASRIETCGSELVALLTQAGQADLTGPEMVTEVLAAFKTIGECVISRFETDPIVSSTGLTKLDAWIKMASRVLLTVKVATVLVIMQDQENLYSIPGEVALVFEPPPPAPQLPPGQPTDGGLSGADSLPSNVILKRAGSPASYWLDSDRNAHHIPDGGTYVCLSKVMPVWYGVDESEWTAAVRGDPDAPEARCPPAPAEERSLTPENSKNVLMRVVEDDAWYMIRPDGTRTLLLVDDEPTCAFDDLLVWDFVTTIEIERFDKRPGEVGTFLCDSWPIAGGG